MTTTILRRTGHALAPLTLAMLLAAAVATGCSTPGSTAGPTDPAAPTAPASASVRARSTVDLAQATGGTVPLAVDDASGTLLEASSGTPGDGASVEPYALVIDNDGPSTLRLVWAAGPCDGLATLSIDATGRSFLLVQPECPGDAVAYDRVLLLRFSGPVAAADVRASIQDGLDTSG